VEVIRGIQYSYQTKILHEHHLLILVQITKGRGRRIPPSPLHPSAAHPARRQTRAGKLQPRCFTTSGLPPCYNIRDQDPSFQQSKTETRIHGLAAGFLARPSQDSALKSVSLNSSIGISSSTGHMLSSQHFCGMTDSAGVRERGSSGGEITGNILTDVPLRQPCIACGGHCIFHDNRVHVSEL